MEHPVPLDDLVTADPKGAGPPLPPSPAPGDAHGAVAAEATVQLGVSVAGAWEIGGETPIAGCAEGPIVIDSVADTTVENVTTHPAAASQ